MKNFLQRFVTNFSQWWLQDSSISTLNNDLGFNYLVKYSGGGSHSDYLPMLIALHGDGDTVDSFYESALNQISVPARIIIIEGSISHEIGYVWPWSVAQFEQYGAVFNEDVDLLSTKYSTIGKPVLLGFSGGGGMAYYQAVKHGNSYSYIFPISSLLASEKLGDSSSQPSAKVYAYHGKSDTVIPFSEGKKTVKLLKKKKVEVSFIPFEGGHHGLFSEMKSEITQAIEERLQSFLYGSRLPDDSSSSESLTRHK
ncbi:MAG: hypothetical protein GQ569_15210 [Methylococcaceae bacterium]|nr:hypothetical protein [Methylococcaceae bacterium]